jgi:hypothetical protein
MIAPASSTKHIQLYIREIVDGIWHDSVGTLDLGLSHSTRDWNIEMPSIGVVRSTQTLKKI